jgi:hypothetical protein
MAKRAEQVEGMEASYFWERVPPEVAAVGMDNEVSRILRNYSLLERKKSGASQKEIISIPLGGVSHEVSFKGGLVELVSPAGTRHRVGDNNSTPQEIRDTLNRLRRDISYEATL